MEKRYNLTLEQNVFLAKKVLISNIYSNARIEGINVTYLDTETILNGVNVSTVTIDDITCILNLRDAWKYVINNINDDINLEFICKINSFVSRNESLEWGKIRNGKVGISGVDYIPDIPVEQDVKNKLKEILNIEDKLISAIKYMLYGMRSQLFWDGNKRTSLIIANAIMIKNGLGVITIKDEHLKEFIELLSEYYNTNDDAKIIKFIIGNCIYGLEI